MDRYDWDGDAKVIMKAAMATGHKGLWTWLGQPDNAGKQKEDWPGAKWWKEFIANILRDPSISPELRYELTATSSKDSYSFNDCSECFACMMGQSVDSKEDGNRCSDICSIRWPNNRHCNNGKNDPAGEGLFHKWCGVKAPLGNSIKVSTQKDLEEKMEIANQIANLPVRDYVYPGDDCDNCNGKLCTTCCTEEKDEELYEAPPYSPPIDMKMTMSVMVSVAAVKEWGDCDDNPANHEIGEEDEDDLFDPDAGC